MFRIDRTLVNLAGLQAANTIDEEAGAEGLGTNPYAPASAEILEREKEILAEAEQKASEIIDNAKDEASLIIHNAREEAKEEKERARQMGFAEGAREAALELEEKMAQDDEVLNSVLREIYDERAQLLDDLKEELPALSISIAEKLIKLASERDESIFISLIATALSQMELDGKITVRVGAAEYARFFKSGSAVFDLGDGITVTATVIKDVSLGELECVIDTENETVSAGLDTQLTAIKLAFERADELG